MLSMNRYQFEDLISDYLENSLSMTKRKEFELYLSKNPGAADLVNQVRNNMLEIKSVKQVKTSADFMDQLMDKIQADKSVISKPVLEQRTLFGFTPVYASLMTGLAVALVFVGSQFFTPVVPGTTPGFNTIAEKKAPVLSNPDPQAQMSRTDLAAAEKDSVDIDKESESDRDYSGKIRYVKD